MVINGVDGKLDDLQESVNRFSFMLEGDDGLLARFNRIENNWNNYLIEGRRKTCIGSELLERHIEDHKLKLEMHKDNRNYILEIGMFVIAVIQIVQIFLTMK